MTYELKNIIKMMKIYSEVESEAKNFLFISAYPLKNKDQKVKIAHSTLKAIENYKKLDNEVRMELENDKNTNVSKLIELEKLCREAIK
jgi:hypothetical protein